MTLKYQAGVPAHCPPAAAENKAATLYRICAKNPPDAEDYTSHFHSGNLGKKRRADSALELDPNDCKPSGLSVRLSESAMRHACRVLPFTKGKFIFSTAVIVDEGKVQCTGTDKDHYTYWPCASTDLQARATFTHGPIDPANI